jgi:hypothetical protein
MSDTVKVLDVVLNGLLLGIGIFLANNFRRQLQLKMVDRRVEAYSHLWALMSVAGPWRIEAGRGAMSHTERTDLYHHMTSWYFSGDGMLLAETTRDVYLNAKFNLICSVESLRLKLSPEEDKLFKESLPDLPHDLEEWRGRLSMRQLSLLRTQMKADLEIKGFTYQRCMNVADRAFLRYAGVNLRKQPWKSSPQCPPGEDPFLLRAGVEASLP